MNVGAPTRRARALRPDGSPDYGPAVAWNRIRYLSVSQITQFDREQDGGCPRRWHFTKVQGLKETEKPWQTAGRKWHGEIEHYLETGEDVLSPVVRAGKHFIPAPGPGLLIEHPFERDELIDARDAEIGGAPPHLFDAAAAGGPCLVLERIPLVGWIDLANFRDHWIDDDGTAQPFTAPGREIEIADWKTTKSITKYAKAPSSLIRTVQLPSYGQFGIALRPDLERVRVGLGYFQTQGRPTALKVSISLSREQIENRWRAISGIVREMVDVAREASIAKVPANMNACDSFGGCPFREQCPREKREVLANLLGRSQSMSLLKSLANGGTVPPPPVAQTANAAPVAAGQPPAPSGSLTSKLGALTGGAPAPSTVAQPAPVAAAPVQTPGYAPPGMVPGNIAPRPAPANPPAYAVLPVVPNGAPIAAQIATLGMRYGVIHGNALVGVVAQGSNKAGLAFVIEGKSPSDGGTITLAPTDQIFPLTIPTPAPAAQPAPVAVAPVNPAPVTPPDAPPSGTVAPAAQPIPPDVQVSPEVAAAAAQVAPTPAPAAQPVATEDRPKRGRGRPRKDAAASAGAQAAAVQGGTTVPTTHATQAESVETGDESGDDGEGGIVVFLNAIPTKGEQAANLAPFVDDLMRKLAETVGIEDVRMAGQDSPLGFGKWRGALHALVIENPPAPGVYYLITRESEARQVAGEAIESVAALVVRGI